MSTGIIIIYWALVILSAFAFALALQMRAMIGLILRRALYAEYGDRPDRERRLAVVNAAAGQSNETEAAHLITTYPRPLAHLRTARRWSKIAPALLLVLLAVGKLKLGMF